jgi:D-amino peptidase
MTPLVCQEGKALRLLVSVDMEGIGNVVNAGQLGPGPEGFEYERFRHLMTAEVNAAIDGALKFGATRITVVDSHGNGLSVIPDELNPKASLVRSWPRPLGMMEGIDKNFDAVFLIGYHASINTPNAVRAHTINSRRFYDVRLNDVHANEALISAAIAGYFDVPVMLVSGDDVTIDEIHRSINRNIVGVVVKRAIGYESAESKSPSDVQTILRQNAEVALRALGSVPPFKLGSPVRVDIAFKNMIEAGIFSLLSFVQRTNGSTIRFEAKDMLDAARFISFVDECEPAP